MIMVLGYYIARGSIHQWKRIYGLNF